MKGCWIEYELTLKTSIFPGSSVLLYQGFNLLTVISQEPVQETEDILKEPQHSKTLDPPKQRSPLNCIPMSP